MIWSQCCTSSGRFIWFFLQWIHLQLVNDTEQHLCYGAHVFAILISENTEWRSYQKGQLLEENLNPPLSQSRKVYFNFCNGACWNWANDAEKHCAGTAFFTCFGQWKYWMKVLPKSKLPEDDLRSTLHQFWKVYLICCPGSWWNSANDAAHHCRTATAFFTSFGQQKYWIKLLLPKGKLPEDDLKSMLYQFRKIYLIFCNGSSCNLANDAEQHFAGAAFLPVLCSENTEWRSYQRASCVKRTWSSLQWSILELGKWYRETLCWNNLSLFWAVKIQNEGATEGQIAWRRFERNPVPA